MGSRGLEMLARFGPPKAGTIHETSRRFWMNAANVTLCGASIIQAKSPARLDERLRILRE
jgi:hypothetical protein